jgi:hypothetical protein
MRKLTSAVAVEEFIVGVEYFRMNESPFNFAVSYPIESFPLGGSFGILAESEPADEDLVPVVMVVALPGISRIEFIEMNSQ